MSAEDDYQSIPISKELVEELDNEAFAKKFRYLRFMAQETIDHLAFLKGKVGDVEGFWASTLLKNNTLQGQITSKSDKDALKYLTHIELVQDPKDPRPFSLKFHFKENPYFSDSVLEKTYELPKSAEAAPADGSVNESMKDFDPTDLVTKPVKISWKSDDKNLCAKQPRANVDANDEDGFDGDFGSFFWYFADGDDTFQTGMLLQQEILPDAVEYFLGRGDDSGDTEFMSGDDEDDELDEEDDDEEGSIDLEDDDEQPSKKKTKTQ